MGIFILLFGTNLAKVMLKPVVAFYKLLEWFKVVKYAVEIKLQCPL